MKQVIIVRKDLNMRAGKMIAQGCHATGKIERELSALFKVGVTSQHVKWWYDWTQQGETKIAVRVESELELLMVFEKAFAANLPCSIITDAGHTEFNGVHTRTVVAIGPCPEAEVDPITGHLKLL